MQYMQSILGEITWFDALLVTLWAGVVVLGLRRGLAGLVWVLGLLVVWPLTTLLSSSSAGLALPLAILLGLLVAYVPRYLVQTRVTEMSHAIVGGVAGLVLGFVLAVALAMSFPISKRGAYSTYPSDKLPPGLQQAVAKSYFVTHLGDKVFAGPDWVKRFVAPDLVSSKK